MFIQNTDAEERMEKYLSTTAVTKEDLIRTNIPYLIFGGAVRDALTGADDCKDVDIAFMSYPKITTLDNGVFLRELEPQAVSTSLSSVNIDGYVIQPTISKKKIDVMFPKYKKNEEPNIISLFSILSEVDINISGIGFNFSYGFIEVVPNAYDYCIRKIFKVNKRANGYTDATLDRRIKLINNGYMEIK